jgi:hypothetical protein
MKYDYQISSHKKKKYLKKVYILTISVFILAALIAGFIKLDTLLQSRKNTPDQTTTQKTTSFYDTKDEIYRTAYFQFQTRNTWNEIPSETTESKYVYRNQRGNLIEEEIAIYINEVPASLSATRVLPVTINNEGQLDHGNVSDHCIKAMGGQSKMQDLEVSYSGVKLVCNSDSTQYEVLVGLKGGTTSFKLKRPDGALATYSIFYRNVKATPDPAQLYQIISSFQTR